MKKEFKEKFRKLEIYLVYLFGSKAKRRESPLSDTDIGVFKKTLLNADTRVLYNMCYQMRLLQNCLFQTCVILSEAKNIVFSRC
jgi:predicted nucleotidyltransferase